MSHIRLFLCQKFSEMLMSSSNFTASRNSLLVMGLDFTKLQEAVQRWEDGFSIESKNQYLPGRIASLTDNELLFNSLQSHNYGHCCIYYQRQYASDYYITEQVKLIEGGSNNDAPRWMCEGRKVPMYHVLARVAAHRQSIYPNLHLSNITLSELNQVTPTKDNLRNPKALSIMHLCGNKWCMNPKHYFVGQKKYNDQQTMCHFGLHNSYTFEEYHSIQLNYCKHSTKCWANIYPAYNITTKFV
jgi:Zinc-binding loop region of homing endonuclease